MSGEVTSTELELRCMGRHGAYPGERDNARPFLVHLALTGDLDADALARAAASTRRAMSEHSRALLERVAEDVATAVLTDVPEIRRVTVRVAKPHPPGLDADAEAVTLTHAR